MVNVTYKIYSFDENLKPCSCYILGIKMTDKQLRIIDDCMWNLPVTLVPTQSLTSLHSYSEVIAPIFSKTTVLSHDEGKNDTERCPKGHYSSKIKTY